MRNIWPTVLPLRFHTSSQKSHESLLRGFAGLRNLRRLKDRKFVSADAVDRRMLEYFTDNVAAAFYIKISVGVAVIIIHGFQSVNINHHNGKILKSVTDLHVNFIRLFYISCFISNAGKRILVILHFVQLLLIPSKIRDRQKKRSSVHY